VSDQRPPIYDERNRFFWMAVRRLLLAILADLERWYGFNANEKK